MIRRAHAVRFDRRAENGRTQPLRVAVETGDGEEHDVFLKPSDAPELGIEGLCCEALAALVGALLGLPVCEPLLVEMSPDWVASITEAGVRGVLERSSAIAFGSTVAGDGWRPWTSTDRVTVDRRSAARAILAFDALIENPDRGRADNPNLLVKNAAFRIIDHEMALRIRMIIPPPQPWMPGGLEWVRRPNGHVLATQLRGTTILDLEDVRAAWLSLTNEALAACGAEMPDEWAAATDAVSVALTHLGRVRDRIDECLAELERVLQ